MKSLHLRRSLYPLEEWVVFYWFHVFASLLQAIQDARLELKLSQKEVAQKVNEKPSLIQDYESSKAIPNSQILAKLERILGVKLRGKIKLWHSKQL